MDLDAKKSCMQVTETPKQFVDDTWMEVASVEDEDLAVALSQFFSKKQPALSEFLLSFSQDLSEDARELAFYIGLVVWRSYEKYFNEKLRCIQSDEVVEQYKMVEQWIDSFESVEDRFIERRILSQVDCPQRNVLEYIVEAIFDGGDESVRLTPNDQGGIFLILKVHMDCLDLAVENINRE